MVRPVQVDQTEQGLDRLLEQFKGKPKIEGTLSTYLTQTKDIEKTIFDLMDNRSLETSKGVQLDNIGILVGEFRNGKSDEDYRKAIKFKIGVNNSEGTPEQLMTLLYDITDSTAVDIFEHYPASYMMSFDGSFIPDNFVNYFQDASSSCINIGLLHDKDNGGWVGQDLGNASQETKAIFVDTGSLTGNYFVDLYNDGLGGSGAVIPFDLSQAFNIQRFQGNGSEIEIDFGFDISDGKCLSLIKNTSGTNNWQCAFSPLMGIDKFLRVGQLSAPYRTGMVTEYTSTGVKLDDGALPTQDQVNVALEESSIITFRQSVGFCDIVKYTGDGQLSQEVPHTIGKNIAFMMVFPLDNTGAAQRTVFWFKGMSSTQYFHSSTLQENVTIWASQLPDNQRFVVGSNIGADDLNQAGTDYIALLLADEPQFVEVGKYQGDGVSGLRVPTQLTAGIVLTKGEGNASFGFVDRETGAFKGRRWSSSSSTTSPDYFRTLEEDGFRVATLAETNTNGEDYFYLAVKSTISTLKPPTIIPNLNEVFSVDTFIGNASDQTIINGIDLINNDGLLFNWPTALSSYVRHYTTEFDAASIGQLGVKGYKNWFQNTSDFSPLNTMNLLSNGFTMAADTTWNGSGISNLAISIRKYTGLIDVVKFTGNGSARQEVPHSLNKDVAALIIQTVETGSPTTAMMWIKDLPSDKALTYTSTVTVGAVWGGSTPTSNMFTVGDIGGNFNMNQDGREYIAYVFAHDPEAGFTAGSYVASGTEGQEIDLQNRLGLFLCRNGNNGSGCINTYKTGIESKLFTASTPTSSFISAIDIEGSKVRLGAANVATNDTGATHYWFNIANPTQ